MVCTVFDVHTKMLLIDFVGSMNSDFNVIKGMLQAKNCKSMQNDTHVDVADGTKLQII